MNISVNGEVRQAEWDVVFGDADVDISVLICLCVSLLLQRFAVDTPGTAVGNFYQSTFSRSI